MTANAILDDTAFAALISSKICHDLAGQIGAINNGLELLEEETDDEARHYALELIQNSAKAAWAQLDFHRLAFGASSGLGAVVPLSYVEQVARSYVENGKRHLHWQCEAAEIGKHHAKLLLALLAVALTALPAGGDVYVGLSILGKGAKKPPTFRLVILCRGRLARVPERVPSIFAGAELHGIDARFILPYYALRLASEASVALKVSKDGEDVMFTAQPFEARASRSGSLE